MRAKGKVGEGVHCCQMKQCLEPARERPMEKAGDPISMQAYTKMHVFACAHVRMHVVHNHLLYKCINMNRLSIDMWVLTSCGERRKT